MDHTVISCIRASEDGDRILAELDDRLRHESANGYIGIATQVGDRRVDIYFAPDVERGQATHRVRAVLDEIDPAWAEHVKVVERTDTGTNL